MNDSKEVRCSTLQYLYIKDGKDLERLGSLMTIKEVYDVFKNKVIKVAGYSMHNPNRVSMIPHEIKIDVTDDNLSSKLVDEFCARVTEIDDPKYLKI